MSNAAHFFGEGPTLEEFLVSDPFCVVIPPLFAFFAVVILRLAERYPAMGTKDP